MLRVHIAKAPLPLLSMTKSDYVSTNGQPKLFSSMLTTSSDGCIPYVKFICNECEQDAVRGIVSIAKPVLPKVSVDIDSLQGKVEEWCSALISAASLDEINTICQAESLHTQSINTFGDEVVCFAKQFKDTEGRRIAPITISLRLIFTNENDMLLDKPVIDFSITKGRGQSEVGIQLQSTEVSEILKRVKCLNEMVKRYEGVEDFFPQSGQCSKDNEIEDKSASKIKRVRL